MMMAHQLSEAPLDELSLETLSRSRHLLNRLINPLRNHVLPAPFLRWVTRRSRSPLVQESNLRPGGWRSMEIIYENAEPLDYVDRLAVRYNPLSIEARNRRRLVSGKLTDLICEHASQGPVTLLGVGAGPGRHVQEAIVNSRIDPQAISAFLVDLDDDAFEYGRQLARRNGIEACLHFLCGDARRIRDVLPSVSPQIVKLIGLIEYLSDAEVRVLLRALHQIMPAGGTLLTHGLVDTCHTGPFLARTFNLRLKQRTAADIHRLLEDCGFAPRECVETPLKVYPIVVALKPT